MLTRDLLALSVNGVEEGGFAVAFINNGTCHFDFHVL
jgi:hypothetical protein